MTANYYKSYGTMRHVRSHWQEYTLHIFPLAPKVWKIGDPKWLTRVREQVYTCRPDLVVIDQSWSAVGRGMTDKQNGMTIRLTLCERDAKIVATKCHVLRLKCTKSFVVSA